MGPMTQTPPWSEAFQDSLLHHFPAILFVATADGDLRFANAAYTQFTQRHGFEGNETNFLRGFSAEDEQDVRSVLRGLAPSRPTCWWEQYVTSCRGAEARLRWTFRGVFDGDRLEEIHGFAQELATLDPLTARSAHRCAYLPIGTAPAGAAEADAQEQQRCQQRLALAFNAFEAGLFDYDAEAGFHWSSQLFQLLGYAPDEFAPSWKRLRAMVHSWDFRLLRDAVKDVIRGMRAGLRLEIRVKSKSGALRWLHLRGKTVRTDRHGHAARIVGMVEDVTDRRNMEESLTRVKDRLQLALRCARQGSWDYDVRNDAYWAEEDWFTALGFEPEDIPRSMRQWHGLLPPEDGKRLTEALEELMTPDSRDSFRAEFRLCNPRGTVYYIRTWCNVMERDEKGLPTRVAGVHQDVTDIAQAELALRESQRLLEEAQSVAHMGHWKYDIFRDRFQASTECYRIFAATKDPGRHLSMARFYRLVHRHDRARVRRSLVDVMREERESRIDFRIRVGCTTKHVRVHAAMRRAPLGMVSFLVGTIQDITEEIQRRQQQQHQQRQLMRAEKLATLGTLVSGIGHEINNPNHFILLNMPVLKGTWEQVIPILDAHHAAHPDFRLRGLPYATARERIPVLMDDIHEGATRIRTIVSELKNYVRPENPDPFVEVHLRDVLDAAVTLVDPFVKKHTRHFSIEVAAETPAVWGNPTRIEQVLINLVQNACYALEDRSGRVHVIAEVDPKRPGARVRVEDDGRGIATENLERLTDPFFTTRQANGGTGLGLSICQRIVHDHGGEMTFESEIGKGTTVTIYLPAFPRDVAPSDVAPSEESAP